VDAVIVVTSLLPGVRQGDADFREAVAKVRDALRLSVYIFVEKSVNFFLISGYDIYGIN
jgi:hypothetical protein